MTRKELQQAIAQAPKFTIKVAGNKSYIAANTPAFGTPTLTSNKAEAIEYAHGFDCANEKLSVWQATSKVKNMGLTFQIVNL